MAELPRASLGSLTLLSLLMLGWAAIVTSLLLYFAWAQWRARRIIRAAIPVDPDLLEVDLEPLWKAAGLRRPIDILASGAVASPAVCGVLRSRLILPPDILDLTPSQMTWVLLHELARRAAGETFGS